MGLQLSSLGYGKIAGTLIFFCGLGVYSAYEKVNQWINYTEVQATISDARVECSFGFKHPKFSGAFKYGPCGELAGLSLEQVLAQNMYRSKNIYFKFVSPADGRVHEGYFPGSENTRFDEPEDRTYAGKTGMILANDDDAGDYRVPPHAFRSKS
jgi:hypothetical protein